MSNGNKKSKVFILAVVLGSIAIVLTSTFIILNVMWTNEDEEMASEEIESIEDQVEEVPEESIEEVPDQNLEEIPDKEATEEEENKETSSEEEKLALKYVPEPGRILKFMHYYTDGTEGQEEQYIGEIEPELLVSKATMIPYDPETVRIHHFVEGEEGIYLVENDDTEDARLWLPYNIEEGYEWKDYYQEYKIMEIGATIEVAGKEFKDCIVRKNTIPIMDFINISYIAPGYGEVYSVYQGGAKEFELVAEKTDDFEMAEDLIKDKIVNLDNILRYKDK